jgi:hypothetical protein
MKFGVREICDVVLKAKAAQKVGNKVFYKNEPVIYFDTLKTSSMEGTATTSYAQGGRGNSRLIAWEGERTVTFTMEDALISPAGFMILSGAGLVEATAKNTLKVHTTEQTNKVRVDGTEVQIVLAQKPYVGKKNADGVLVGAHEDLIYVMKLDNGEVATEPYIPDHNAVTAVVFDEENDWYAPMADGVSEDDADGWMIVLNGAAVTGARPVREANPGFDEVSVFANEDVVLVDYYVEHATAAQQIEITPDKFGGNYYLEASTLFRDTNGVDMPAEFIIPNCKIQSNFTFTMASSGDPSTFTFTMDAFPDYTRFDPTKKVLAAIQIIQTGNAAEVGARTRTSHDPAHEKYLM